MNAEKGNSDRQKQIIKYGPPHKICFNNSNDIVLILYFFITTKCPKRYTTISETNQTIPAPEAPNDFTSAKFKAKPTTAPIIVFIKIILSLPKGIKICNITICANAIKSKVGITICKGKIAPENPGPDKIKIICGARTIEQ